MLSSLSIHGNISTADNIVVTSVNYKIHNLTTGYISKEYTTIDNYYNINIFNMQDTYFNTNDILNIEFYTVINNIRYVYKLYINIIQDLDCITEHIVLEKKWDHYSVIQYTEHNDNRIKIKFITTRYDYIHYKLYVKYNDIYKELSSTKIDKQVIYIGPLYAGMYKIIGYVISGNKLLSSAYKEFTVNTSYNQTMYFDWE